MQSACSRGPLIQSLSQGTFSRGLLSNKRDREEQISYTSPLPILQPKPKRFQSKKAFLKDNPREVGVNEHYFKQSAKKQFCFCTYKHFYTCISCCKLFNKQQSFSQYSQSLTQFSLAMGPRKACTQQSSRAQQLNRSPMHGVNQLKTNNIRPLGFRGNTRVQDRFLEATIPGMSVSPTASLSEGCTVNEQGGPQTLRKESICSGGPTEHTRVPVQSVRGSQKRWLSKTSDKPVPTRSICHLGTLQDGKHSSSRAPNPGGGLDGKNRSQGCILCSPNSQGPSTMATFSLARPGLPVLLPSIRPVLSPPGVHKDHTPNSGVAEATGSEIDCLHRRLSPFSSLQGGSPRISLTHDHCTASIGFLDQQREVHPSTLPGNRILRSDSSVSLSTPA